MNLWRWSIRLALVPLFALYGAWVLVAGLFSLLARARAGVALLQESLPCPSCGARNALHGRWQCRSCGAIFHGFVGHCPLCGSGAAWFPCSECGISIPLRGGP